MTSEIEGFRTPAEEDRIIEAAVMRQLLSFDPPQASFEELLREVDGDPADFYSRDLTERAVRDLVAVGLLHRSGELIVPSRAALRLDELLGD